MTHESKLFGSAQLRRSALAGTTVPRPTKPNSFDAVNSDIVCPVGAVSRTAPVLAQHALDSKLDMLTSNYSALASATQLLQRVERIQSIT